MSSERIHLSRNVDEHVRVSRLYRPSLDEIGNIPGNPGYGGLEGSEVARLARLGTMAAGTAHDLSNLLQVVASAVALIDRAVDGETRSALLPMIGAALASVERAGVLSRQIFDIRKSNLRAVSPTSIVDKLTEIGDTIALAAGPAVAVEFLLDATAPPVLCDPCALESAVLNLVINARHAMPMGGFMRIAVSREEGPLDSDVPHTVLRVADTGCGMSQEVASRVFDPFVTTRSKGQGTGLGLAMVAEFVAAAGGSIELESHLGQGTLFVIRLPGMLARSRSDFGLQSASCDVVGE